MGGRPPHCSIPVYPPARTPPGQLCKIADCGFISAGAGNTDSLKRKYNISGFAAGAETTHWSGLGLRPSLFIPAGAGKHVLARHQSGCKHRFIFAGAGNNNGTSSTIHPSQSGLSIGAGNTVWERSSIILSTVYPLARGNTSTPIIVLACAILSAGAGKHTRRIESYSGTDGLSRWRGEHGMKHYRKSGGYMVCPLARGTPRHRHSNNMLARFIRWRENALETGPQAADRFIPAREHVHSLSAGCNVGGLSAGAGKHYTEFKRGRSIHEFIRRRNTSS